VPEESAAKPAHSHGRPVYISWSSLRAHLECKQKAALLRSGKKNASSNIRGYFHGTVVDRVMRTWLENDPQPGEMPGMVEDILNAEELKAIADGDGVVRWKSATDRADTTKWCQELVRRLEPILYDKVIPFEYEVAKRYRVPVIVPFLDGSPREIFLAGEMDLLVRDEHRQFRIWDLKGTADDSYWKKTMGQLIFYDVSTHAMFEQYAVESGLIQPMCKNQVLSFTFTEDDYANMWNMICRMATDIWQRDDTPKESNSGCSFCHVRHACSKFAPVNPGANERRMSLQGMARLGQEVTTLMDIQPDPA
jgi:hypothetical protein